MPKKELKNRYLSQIEHEKLVSIIIVNWNGKKWFKDCLGSVYKQDYKNMEVILVDNASADGSVTYVKKYFPKVKIVINKKNLGFAQANNIGYKEATGDYVLFLNNDTKVTNNFLTELVKVLESDKKIGGAQSKILLMDDPTRLDSVGAFLTNTGFLYHYGIAKEDSPKYDRQIDIYSAKGACMIFKREVLEKIKVDGEIFDSRYFAYFEETDMCHRVWLSGYRIVFAPKSIIYHKMGGTSTRLDNSFVQYHSFKNRINSYIKNLDEFSLLKILPSHLLICEAYAFLLIAKLRFDVFLSIQKAIIWNIVALPATIKKRNYIRSLIKNKNINEQDLYKILMKKVRLSYFYYLYKGIEKYDDFKKNNK